MGTQDARICSRKLASEKGVTIPDSLPLLEDDLTPRDQNEAISRLLCLNATAAVAYGFAKAKAMAWIDRENLATFLMDDERRFLEKGEGIPRGFIMQIEGMWALAWALNLVSELDFWKDCASNFDSLFPDLRTRETSSAFRQRAAFRSPDELVSACDLAYSLHWAVRQAEIENKLPPAKLKPYVVVKRRRALEWVLSTEEWNDISLDT
jgi:Domain of unknown function (DUF4272)